MAQPPTTTTTHPCPHCTRIGGSTSTAICRPTSRRPYGGQSYSTRVTADDDDDDSVLLCTAVLVKEP
ncbi:hypothetical protein AAFF_G00021750 [Aldrovandia affinis]|uniref:Uncharacterized protein n=1 Tax=Aldrovandia affinis TaxID=143900 RepID=A0AAD7WGH0_9TELE|nr:hypothetical protein AAFF_G00021750 [Aldrovandia affinis]